MSDDRTDAELILAWDNIDKIRNTLREFHLALDMREHNAAASWAAITRIEGILDMPYQQGVEESRRRTGK